jgi:hypothetical protein
MVHYALLWSVALQVIENVSRLPSFRFYLLWSLSLSILKNKSHLQHQTIIYPHLVNCFRIVEISPMWLRYIVDIMLAADISQILQTIFISRNIDDPSKRLVWVICFYLQTRRKFLYFTKMRVCPVSSVLWSKWNYSLVLSADIFDIYIYVYSHDHFFKVCYLTTLSVAENI